MLSPLYLGLEPGKRRNVEQNANIYINKYAREAYRNYQRSERYRSSGRTGSSGLLRTTFRGSPTYLRGLPTRLRQTWQIGAGTGFDAVGFEECLGWFAYLVHEIGERLG